MAQSKLTYVKRGDTTYVYSDTPYWDKIKKYSTHKKVLVGKLAPDGSIVKGKKQLQRETNEMLRDELDAVRAQAHETPPVIDKQVLVGQKMILDKFVSESNLKEPLAMVFGPKDAEKILAMSYFDVCEGKAFCHAAPWLEARGMGHLGLSSCRISELEGRINTELVNRFFREWNKGKDKEAIVYDITSVSTYGRRQTYAEAGYNRDGEDLEQINLGLIQRRDDRMPLLYDRFSGSVSDKIAVEGLLNRAEGLKIPIGMFVGDRAFFTKDIVSMLKERTIDYLIPIPGSFKWVNGLIEANKDSIEHPGNIIESEEEGKETFTYGMTIAHEGIDILSGMTVHMYFNASLRNQVIGNQMARIRRCKEDLLRGTRKKADEKIYSSFLLEIKDDSGETAEVRYDDDAIRDFKETAGYWLMACSKESTAKESLEMYRERNFDEVSFDDLKNTSDLRRLRTHNGNSTDGKLFIMFIAQIIRQAFRNKVLGMDPKKRRYMSYAEMLRWVTSYSETVFEGTTKKVYTTPSKHQREIFDLLNLPYYYKEKMHNAQKNGSDANKGSAVEDTDPKPVGQEDSGVCEES